MNFKIIAKGFSLILLGLTFSACDRKETEQVSEKRVFIQKAESVSDFQYRDFTGLLRPVDTWVMSFTLPGKIKELPVEVGQSIEAGGVIAAQDLKFEKLKREQINAQRLYDSAQLQNAKNEYDRQQNLMKTGSTTQQRYENAQAQYIMAQASVEKSNALLAQINEEISERVLRAPERVYVASVDVTNEQTIQPTQPIARLISLERLEIEVGVPENYLSEIYVGMPIKVVLEKVPGKAFNAVVKNKGVTSTATTTYPVTVEMTEFDPQMRPGMLGTVQFQFHQNKNTIQVKVPALSVVSGVGKQPFVWVYHADERSVEKKAVTVGQIVGDEIVIKQGIDQNTWVVSKGHRYLVDGEKVRSVSDVTAYEATR